MMTDSKWWLNSNTVRGALMAGVVVLKQALDLVCLMKLGCNLIQDAEINAIVDAIVGVVGVVGVVMVIINRWRSTRSPLRFNREE